MKVAVISLTVVWIILAAILMITSSCSALPQVQATDAEGNPQYYAIDENGQSYKTSEKVDPVTGVERDPVMVVDENKVESGGQAAINTVSGLLPAPWGTYLSLGGNGLLALALVAIRLYNKRKLDKLEQEKAVANLIAEDVVLSIEQARDSKNPSKVDMNKVVQDPMTEKFVAEVVKSVA